MISNIQTTVLQPIISEYDFYQGFANIFAGVSLYQIQ